MESDFALSISLFHAFDLLQLHGMNSFHKFLSSTFSSYPSSAKKNVMRSPLFKGIMKQLEHHFCEARTNTSHSAHFPVTVGARIDTGKVGDKNGKKNSSFYSHPKLQKMEEVVLEHFRSLENGRSSSCRGECVSSRVMIFSEYRESVQEISNLLSQHTPLIKAMTFVGHSTGKSSSKGLTQKEQTEASSLEDVNCVHMRYMS